MLGGVLFGPLHHGGAVDADANFVQRFVDSDLGVILAIFAHTFGALLFTAGLAVYAYQARLVRQARDRNELPTLRFLPYAHVLNIFGIGLNGVGGLMRLYESDHPGLDQLGSSLWVQLLVVKHLFLVLGVGLAAFLTLRTYWMARGEEAPRNFFGETGRITALAVASFLTILLASVLGAVASNTALPDTEPTDGSGVMEPGPTPAAAPAATTVRYSNASGTITGTPVQPGRATMNLAVSNDTQEVWLELSWTNARAATLDLAVLGPDGKAVTGAKTQQAGRIQFVVNGTIVAGQWEVVVSTSQAVNEPYSVVGRLRSGPPANLYEGSWSVVPGPASAYEVNLNMAAGQRIEYEWSVISSADTLNFNVHTHPPGAPAKYHVEGTWNRYAGNYTQEAGQGETASLMWENRNPVTVRVHFRILGQFSFHSAGVLGAPDAVN